MPAGPDQIIRDLLERPFGPYLDETILSDKCQHTSSKRLVLEHLMLSYRGKPTGFDRTEFIGPFVPSNVTHLLPPTEAGSYVQFRGVLSIPALSHLSDTGLRYLNHDLRERLMGTIVNGIASARKHLAVTIEAIFESKTKQKQLPKLEVRVLIQGIMCSKASFMRSDVAPDGLLLHTSNAAKTSFRVFEVVSMDVETYQLSRTFLFRYHTLRTLRDILGNYKSGVTALDRRTPYWFLEQYFHGSAYPRHRRWRRINFVEDTESSDDGPVNVMRPTNAQTRRPRHLRVIHKNEVWSIFASHSEWIFSLVQEHKDLKGEADGYAWECFLANIPRLRERSMSYKEVSGRWGLRDEQEESQAHEARPVVDTVASIKHTGKPSTISKKSKHKTSSSHHPVISIRPSSKRHDDEHIEHIYDSDFSQVSSASDNSSPDFATLGSYPLRDLLPILPPEMSTPPTLPADMLWHCPIGGGTCRYAINLFSPSDDNLRHVSYDNTNYLLNEDWKCNDEQLMMVFYEMVNAHWEEHLRELDIKHVRHNNTSTFQWIHSQKQLYPLKPKYNVSL